MEKEKVSELFSNREFLKELFKRKSEKDIKELFLAYDTELTPEELEELMDVVEACTSGFMVLPDSSLDDVVGGVYQTEMARIFKDNYIVISEVLKEKLNFNRNN